MAADYIILEGETEAELEPLVEAKLDLGYSVSGGLTIATDKDGVYRYHQAVYKL